MKPGNGSVSPGPGSVVAITVCAALLVELVLMAFLHNVTSLSAVAEAVLNAVVLSLVLLPILLLLVFRPMRRQLAARGRAEEALRQSEKRFRELADSSPEGIVITDPGGRHLYVNRRYAEITGYGVAELLGMTGWDLTRPDDAVRLKEVMRKRMHGESHPRQYERVIVRKDGAEILTEFTTTTVVWKGEVCPMAVVRDITEQKLAEELVRGQRDLGLALGGAGSLDETLGFCVEAAIRVSGMDVGGVYLVDDRTGDLDLVVHKGLPARFVESAAHYNCDSGHARMVMAGKPYYTSYEELLLPIDDARRGEKLRALAVVPVFHEGRVVACMNIASHRHDVVPVHARRALEVIAAGVGNAIARARAEDALREERSMFTGGDVVVMKWLYEEGYPFVYVSPNVVDVFGYTPEDLTSRKVAWSDLLCGPEKESTLRESYHCAYETNDRSFDQQDYRLRCKDGREIWLSDHTTIVRDAEGKPVHGLAYIIDITARKRAEDELVQHREHLEELVVERTRNLQEVQGELVRREKLAALGQVAGSVAHELRNPLGSIRNAAYFLQMTLGDKLDAKQARHLALITDETLHSDRVITAMLDFARGKESKPSRCGLRQILMNAVRGAKLPAGIEVGLVLSESLPDLQVDPDEMEHAFRNLLLNANQAMEGRGRVSVSASSGAGTVSVVVADSGPGIKPEYLSRLFEPLFSTRTVGIGLGLPICRSYVEANRGTIEVESRPGEGAVFTVVLPAVRD